MIDEYQDINHIQYLIIKKLAALNENICIVGDDAQSIYAFRGANIQNILNFKIDYPDYKTCKLEQNYRSTSTIVEAANSIIKHNEKQIEKDRQFLRHRITRLKRQLIKVEKERKTQKKRRSNCLCVSLIGYTNAGKSTLMNALTNSALLVEDRLFATLDSTTRLLEEDSRPKVLLSDTVGFISNLPHEVVAAFRSTLSIVKEADLLLQIIDASDNIDEHMQTANDVLQDLGAASIPVIKIFNKTDRLTPTRMLMLEKMYPEAIFVSAIEDKHKKFEKTSDFIHKIRKQIQVFFEERMKTVEIRLDYQHCQQLANIYEWSRVDKIDYQEQGIMMTLTAIPRNLERLRHHLGSNITEMR